MRILTIASSPGPAESLALVVKGLKKAGHEVELINITNEPINLDDKKNFGRSALIFNKMNLNYKEAETFGLIENYFDISNDFADAMIDKIKPQKVLTGTYRDISGTKVTLEDAIILSAKRKGLPVFQYVDLWDNWFPKKNLDIIPDFFLVNDTIAKEMIKKRGNISEYKFFIVGNPGLENFIQNKLIDKKFNKSDFGLGQKNVMAYFGQCIPVRNDITLHWTVNCLDEDDMLIFSKHPRDQRDYSYNLKNPNVMRLSISSDEILDFADVCITHTSTLSLKASLLNIKTINIILEGECQELLDLYGGYPLSIMGGSMQVRTEEELKQALRERFVRTGKFKKKINEIMQGNSESRILGIIENQAGKGK